MRLFIGVEIAADVCDHISGWMNGVRRLSEYRGFRWTRPSNFHITLRFFGEVSSETRAKLESSIDPYSFRAVEPVRLSGIGVFPFPERPKVLWAGVTPPAEMTQWARDMETIARECGFEPEYRPFRPHLTLARIGRTPRQGWLEDLSQTAPPVWGEYLPLRVALFESVSGGEAGVEYRILRTWPCSEGHHDDLSLQ